MLKKILGFMLLLGLFTMFFSEPIHLNVGKNTIKRNQGDTLWVSCEGDTIVHADTLWSEVYVVGPSLGSTWYMSIEIDSVAGADQDGYVLAQWGIDPENLGQIQELFAFDDTDQPAIDSCKAITPQGAAVKFGIGYVSDANDSCRVEQWDLWINSK